MRIFCSQCRERLIDLDVIESHCEYICQACDMKLLLLKGTEVKLGESACACGSTDLLEIGETKLPDEAAKAGGLIDRVEGDDGILEDTDWLRPGSSEDYSDEDYEDYQMLMDGNCDDNEFQDLHMTIPPCEDCLSGKNSYGRY